MNCNKTLNLKKTKSCNEYFNIIILDFVSITFTLLECKKQNLVINLGP